jgi:diaminohydroxyphosphoribosylaminopyrimidine deaminase/5-amino-6-(5-phosphoribosylamino)uracil reductase
MSLDGRTALADGQSKWITGDAARADVQRWRARSSAILTGSGTVMADDPRLTVRLGNEIMFKTPLRVVLDRALRTTANAHVLDGSVPTLIFHGEDASASDDRFARAELAAAPLRDGRLDIGAVLSMLAERGINELQVEAGATLCGALFAAGYVDELLLYVAPVILGDQARGLLNLPALTSMEAARRLRVIDQRQISDDLRVLLRG